MLSALGMAADPMLESLLHQFVTDEQGRQEVRAHVQSMRMQHERTLNEMTKRQAIMQQVRNDIPAPI